MAMHGRQRGGRALLALVLDVGTLAVALAAAVVLVRRIQHPTTPSAEARPRYPRRVANWAEFSQRGARVGPQQAAVTIVEFGDYECQFCTRAATYLNRLRQRFPGDVAIVYRHYPIHEHAFAAAVAAECAREQGFFEPFHDALYGGARLIGTIPWTAFAREAGIPDTLTFVRCMRGGQAAAAVSLDTSDAARLRVRGTPTFLVNDVVVPGFAGDQIMDSVVRSRLMQARTSR